MMKTGARRPFAVTASALVSMTCATSTATAEDAGPWLVRARVVHLESSNRDETGFGLKINDRVIPEVDISYYLSPNLAAELILTYPQEQTIHSSVVGADIGTFKHLPPTLTVQYHFTGLGGFRPYVGAGINYTRLTSAKFDDNVSALNLSVKRNSFGLAAQLGIDVPLGDSWLLNADLKKVQIGTTVYSNGSSVGRFRVDPVLFGLGVGKQF